MKKTTRTIALISVFALALAACGDDSGSGGGDIEGSDLGGMTVTIGVENAYLPFNYVLPGETEGQVQGALDVQHDGRLAAAAEAHR